MKTSFNAPRLSVRNAALLILTLVLAVLIMAPIAMVFYGSVRTAPPGLPGGFTLEKYGFLLTPQFLELVLRSLYIGVTSTAVAVVIGTLLAIAIIRLNIVGKKTFNWLVVVPAYLSPFVGAVAWIMLLSPSFGYINGALRLAGLPALDIYTHGGIIWVTGLYYAPIAYLFIKPVLMGIDKSLEEAAWMMGASRRLAILLIILPLSLPAIVSAALIIFVNTIGDFAIPGVLGARDRIEVIPTALLRLTVRFPSDPNTAAVLGVFLMAITVIGLRINNWIISKGNYTTISGKGGISVEATKRNMISHLGLAFVVAYVLLALVFPLIAMIIASFQAYPTTNIFNVRYDLSNYAFVFSFPSIQRSIINSFLLSLGTALCGSIISLFLGYFIVRSPSLLTRFLDYVGTSTIAVPHTVVALGMIWLWITIPFGVYGTIWILLFAYLAVYLPFSLRTVVAAFLQIDRSLEDAGRVFGASWLTVILRVVAPMMIPGMLAGATMLIYYSFRELTASLMLYTAGSEVMATSFWEIFSEGRYGQLFALSIINVIIVFAMVAIAEWFGRKSVSMK